MKPTKMGHNILFLPANKYYLFIDTTYFYIFSYLDCFQHFVHKIHPTFYTLRTYNLYRTFTKLLTISSYLKGQMDKKALLIAILLIIIFFFTDDKLTCLWGCFNSPCLDNDLSPFKGHNITLIIHINTAQIYIIILREKTFVWR